MPFRKSVSGSVTRWVNEPDLDGALSPPDMAEVLYDPTASNPWTLIAPPIADLPDAEAFEARLIRYGYGPIIEE